MTFAIIKTGGKQYRVAAGDILNVEKLAYEGDKVTFDEVLLIDDGKETKVGTPMIAGAKVTATVVADGKGKKLHVIKYKAKSNRKKKIGHRQLFTKVKIEGIK